MDYRKNKHCGRVKKLKEYSNVLTLDNKNDLKEYGYTKQIKNETKRKNTRFH